MIEAVNSVLSNAALLRGVAEQGASARSFAANPDRVQEVAAPAAQQPLAPYISPYIAVNYDYDRAVLQIRDADTGDVLNQFPSEKRMAEIRRSQQVKLDSEISQRSSEVTVAKDVVPDAPQSTAGRGQVRISDQGQAALTAVQAVPSAPTGGSGEAQIASAALASASTAASSSSVPSSSSSVSVLA